MEPGAAARTDGDVLGVGAAPLVVVEVDHEAERTDLVRLGPEFVAASFARVEHFATLSRRGTNLVRQKVQRRGHFDASLRVLYYPSRRSGWRCVTDLVPFGSRPAPAPDSIRVCLRFRPSRSHVSFRGVGGSLAPFLVLATVRVIRRVFADYRHNLTHERYRFGLR